MSCARSSRRSPREPGFTLVELLASVTLVAVASAAIAQFFQIQARRQSGHAFRVELHQGLRSSLDAITRDLRLGGACMPSDGDFVSIAGTDSTTDSVTVRAGKVRTDMSCIQTALTANAAKSQKNLTVGSPSGFAVNMRVYLRHPGGTGQFSFVSSITGNTVRLTTNTNKAYPVGSGLFAIDERVYSIITAGSQKNLNLTIDQGTPQIFAAGIEDLQLRYILQQNCPPCDVVDLPANAAQWRLVNQVMVTATGKTIGAAKAEDQMTLTETSRAKPRNLLP
jgi:prepilin-type N-terminal cleavage/methylation domain-containing protein